MQAYKADNGRFSVSGPDSSRDEDRANLGKFSPASITKILQSSLYSCAFAFDPGDSTGVAVLTAKAGSLFQATFTQKGFLCFLSEHRIWCFGPSISFYEQFVSRPSLISRTQIAPENIGAIKMWATNGGCVKTVPISPAQTHKLNREELRAAGWTWKTEHEFDALRILIYGMTMLGHSDTTLKAA